MESHENEQKTSLLEKKGVVVDNDNTVHTSVEVDAINLNPPIEENQSILDLIEKETAKGPMNDFILADNISALAENVAETRMSMSPEDTSPQDNMPEEEETKELPESELSNSDDDETQESNMSKLEINSEVSDTNNTSSLDLIELDDDQTDYESEEDNIPLFETEEVPQEKNDVVVALVLVNNKNKNHTNKENDMTPNNDFSNTLRDIADEEVTQLNRLDANKKRANEIFEERSAFAQQMIQRRVDQAEQISEQLKKNGRLFSIIDTHEENAIVPAEEIKSSVKVAEPTVNNDENDTQNVSEKETLIPDDTLSESEVTHMDKNQINSLLKKDQQVEEKASKVG